MARGSTGPSPLPARGSGRREAARAAARPRVERAGGGWIHRTRRATNPDAARLVQIAPHRVAFDPIATCLVPRDRFSGDARTKARARTFSALCRRAVARGFTRLGRRVDEREFLSCRSRADRCGRCGDRRRFAGGLASVEAKLALILRVFETANPTRSRPSSRLRRPAHVDLKTDGRKQLCAARFFSNFTVRDSTFELGLSVRQFDPISTFRKLARESSLFLHFWRSWHSRHSRATRVLPGSGRAAENGHGGRARVRDAPSRAGGRLRRDASARAEAGRTTRCAESRAGRRAPR